jgi:endogenous inhibitor of DNA gyrase (YacG/DUF329 family)
MSYDKNTGRYVNYDPETGKYVRHCKQCGKMMSEPLHVEEKLFMFCSAQCHQIWDHERAYRTKKQDERYGY